MVLTHFDNAWTHTERRHLTHIQSQDTNMHVHKMSQGCTHINN